MGTTIHGDRVFSAQVPTGTRGTARPDAAWGQRAQQFFDRGNTIAIDGHELDGAHFRQILSTSDPSERSRLASQALGQPHLDWADTRRFIDDVMVASPSASGQRFSITTDQARTYGLVDEVHARRYGGHDIDVQTGPRPGPHDAQLSALAPGASQQLVDAYRDHAEVRSLVDGDSFQHLTQAQQTSVLDGLHAPGSAAEIDAVRASRYSQLIGDRQFGSLTRADQTSVLDVARQEPTERLDDLHTVLARGALTATGIGGAHDRTLDSFHRLATEPLHSDRVDRSELLGSLTSEVADPSRITQGTSGMCGTTSIQYAIAHRSTAEYARIVSRLATDGSVPLRDGSTVQMTDQHLGRDILRRDDQGQAIFDTRTPSERIFQGSMASSVFASPTRGLYGNYAADMMSRVFDRPYGISSTQPELEPTTLTRRDVTQATPEQLVDQLRDTHGPSVVGMRFGRSPTDEHAMHDLTFDRVEDGRVYLRNPWGGHPQQYYDDRSLDFVRVEDAGTGEISMSEADFRSRVVDVVHPE